jgi:hypothetical protein
MTLCYFFVTSINSCGQPLSWSLQNRRKLKLVRRNLIMTRFTGFQTTYILAQDLSYKLERGRNSTKIMIISCFLADVCPSNVLPVIIKSGRDSANDLSIKNILAPNLGSCNLLNIFSKYYKHQ